jgi:Spy/CpxP family protein refolding chaperone
MMKGSKALVALGFVAVLAAVLPVSAQSAEAPPPPPPPPQGGPPPPPPADPAIGIAGWALHGLELEVEQRDQIHDVVNSHVEGGLGELLHDFDQAKRELEIAIWNPAISDEELGVASDAVAGLARQIESARRLLALDVLQVLTEEQRETLQRILETEPPLPGGPGHGGQGGPEGRRGPGPQGR